MATELERVTTDQLVEGDVVHNERMIILLGPIYISPRYGANAENGPVFYSNGQVQNPLDVKLSDPLVWSLLHQTYWDDKDGWTPAYSGIWAIQGNRLASWSREVRPTAITPGTIYRLTSAASGRSPGSLVRAIGETEMANVWAVETVGTVRRSTLVAHTRQLAPIDD